jgi:predicted nucleic acid-binding protein
MVLFDSMVIVYALADLPQKTNAKKRDISDKIEASKEALRRADRINISAISYVEVGRGITSRDRYESLYPRLNVLQVDASVAHRALEILNDRRVRQSLCKTCLSAKNSVPCKGCGSQRSAHQRIADAFIVATADTHPDIERLYTYDSGIKELAEYVIDCKIEEPPHPIGPLFSRRYQDRSSEADPDTQTSDAGGELVEGRRNG